MKKSNMILLQKVEKYLHCYQKKKIGYECLRGEVPPNQSRAIEKARFT